MLRTVLLFCWLGASLPVLAQETAPTPPPVTPAHAAPEKIVRPRRTVAVPEPTPAATPPENEPPTDEQLATGVSESTPLPPPRPSKCEGFPLGQDIQSILQNAKSLFIRSKAATVRAHEIENTLLKRKDFPPLKITLTRNESDADLILELGHKHLSTRFFFTIMEPCTQSVVAGGRVSSLFGTVDGKVADSVVKQIKQARQP